MRTRTPSGSVQHGPVVWPAGNPNSTGPGTSAAKFAATSRAVGVPDAGAQPKSIEVELKDGKAKLESQLTKEDALDVRGDAALDGE